MESSFISAENSVYRYIKFLCMCFILSACQFQQYTAKPIDISATANRIENKTPENEQFKQYLLNNGYKVEQLPIQHWGLAELTYCALFFHPSLDVARAQWRTAEHAKLTAGASLPSTINGNIGNSNNANNDKSPYLFGLSIGIPIETSSKREIRIENAAHLSEAAKLEIAQSAWQLRHQVASALYNYQFNQLELNILDTEYQYRQSIVAMIEKRVALGMASNIELSTAKSQRQSVLAELNAKQNNNLILLTQLANHLGLPVSAVKHMTLAEMADPEPVADMAAKTADSLQSNTLLNRLDIRAALERYASAEARLKLEIARQYPDLVMSPAYTYEFGNQVWALGISGLMTFLNKNKFAIAEATDLREMEGAQFEFLQSNAIAETNTAKAKLFQARETLAHQKQLHVSQIMNTQRMKNQFLAGEIDRLTYTLAQLEEVASKKNVALSSFLLQLAILELENVQQKPLNENIPFETIALDQHPLNKHINRNGLMEIKK